MVKTKIEQINALIPDAVREARRKVKKLGKKSFPAPGADGSPYNYDYFTFFYHNAMDRMAKEAGLRV